MHIHMNTTQSKDFFFIAEIGVNHNGEIDLAKELVLKAKSCGANAVKFQSFVSESLASKETAKVPYQEARCAITESHLEMLKRLELCFDDQKELKDFCDNEEIEFLSTPYDTASTRFLVEDIGCKKIKIASADLIDWDIHSYLADHKDIEILMSTGMSNLSEIEAALSIYDATKSRQRVKLLHCVSAYPCSDISLNLKCIQTLVAAFGQEVGYSDHSPDDMSAVLATSLGVRIFEKHFTLDKNMEGPDHRASYTPVEFKRLIKSCQRAADIMGTPRKGCQQEERDMKRVSRKSIHAGKDIGIGQEITKEDLTFRRPGTGISPMDWRYLAGFRATKRISEGELISWDMVR